MTTNKRPRYVAVKPVTPLTGKGRLIQPGEPVPVDHLTEEQVKRLVADGVIRAESKGD